MEDSKLADIIIDRLNELIKDSDIREDIRDLLDTDVDCSQATANHPTIQTIQVVGGMGPYSFLSFLGLLNGIVGSCPDEYGIKKGCGLITAVYNEGQLVRFERTAKPDKIIDR
jgi:hypothetical protein